MPRQSHDIRRRADGSIDIGFYRHEGLTERRAVMNAALRRIGARRALVAAAVFAIALYVIPSRDIAGRDTRTASALAATGTALVAR